MSGTWASGWSPGDVLTAAEVKKGVGAIFDSTLGIAAASIDIPSIIATYAHLRLWLYARGDTAAAAVNLNMRFNNDSSGAYQYQWLQAVATTPAAGENVAPPSFIFCGAIPAASVGGGVFGQTEIDIAHYAGVTNQKTANIGYGYRTGGSTGQGFTGRSSGWWSSGAAINRITLFPATGNFAAGTRATLYAWGA